MLFVQIVDANKQKKSFFSNNCQKWVNPIFKTTENLEDEALHFHTPVHSVWLDSWQLFGDRAAV